ncbi:MAG: ATP-dependent helicase [Succinivibrio sp.]|nr:ATP-dependent helicase [Succinivibrio sp.]
MPENLLAELNEEQRAAVTATEGYVRVLAGPGTGKTKCLTYRYAYLLKALGISPQAILCITFTNKAAGEMKQRLLKLCGQECAPFVTTFHGFCAEFLRDHADKAGLASNFTILDVADVRDLLKPIYQGLNIDGRTYSLQDGWNYIDARKSLDLSYVRDLLTEDTETLRIKAGEEVNVQQAMFYLYLYQQRVCHALDYDDLIALTLHVLKENAEVRRMWQERLEYILVDEFQDIDKLQYEICEILAELEQNLFIVGDPDQTIYTFRGADVAFFTDFVKVHPEAKCIYLKRNYRSTAEILNCAYTLISHNRDPGRVPLQAMLPKLKPEELVPLVDVNDQDRLTEPQELMQLTEHQGLLREFVKPGFKVLAAPRLSAKPLLAYVNSFEEEAEYVCRLLESIMQTQPRADCAILYRAHHISRQLEKALLLHKIPYRIVNDQGFFECREIKDLIAYLRLCLNPQDDAAFRRIYNTPARGFGQKRFAILQRTAEEAGLSLFETLELLKEQNETLFKGTRMFDFLDGVRHCAQQLQALLPSKAVELVLTTFGYEEVLKSSGEKERLQNVAGFKQLAFDYENRAGERTIMADFVRELALDYARDEQELQPQVKLMTVHNAKGLEFDYVFVVGLSEGIFPSFKSTRLYDLEEERRLLYVAMTRARRQLFMTVPEGLSRLGRPREPSRFVADFKAQELEVLGASQLPGHSAAAAAQPAALFAPNEQVFHEIMGVGTVLEVREDKGEYVVSFESLKRPRTLSFSAPLSRLPH